MEEGGNKLATLRAGEGGYQFDDDVCLELVLEWALSQSLGTLLSCGAVRGKCRVTGTSVSSPIPLGSSRTRNMDSCFRARSTSAVPLGIEFNTATHSYHRLLSRADKGL